MRIIAANAARRRKPRVAVRLSAIVRGTEAGGKRFEVLGRTLELGGGGVYLDLPRAVDVPSPVFVAIRFGDAGERGSPAPLLAVRGTALRVDSRVDGGIGVAVGLKNYRFV
jgi:hypothetical protein